MADTTSYAIQKLNHDKQSLMQSGIVRLFAQSHAGGVKNYVCYLPEFDVIMDSQLSFEKAEELCFKYLSHKFQKLEGNDNMDDWAKSFRMFNIQLMENGHKRFEIKSDQVQNSVSNFLANFSLKGIGYELSPA